MPRQIRRVVTMMYMHSLAVDCLRRLLPRRSDQFSVGLFRRGSSSENGSLDKLILRGVVVILRGGGLWSADFNDLDNSTAVSSIAEVTVIH